MGRRGGGGALLLLGCSSTGLGLLSVPLDLVVFPAGMGLVPVPLKHADSRSGAAGGSAGRKAGRRAPGGGKRTCFENVQEGESSLA